VCAIVEHQQQPAIPERTDQARNRIIGANIETSICATALGTSRASASGAKSTNQTHVHRC